MRKAVSAVTVLAMIAALFSMPVFAGDKDMAAKGDITINLPGNTLITPAIVIAGQEATIQATGQNAALTGTPAEGTVAYFPESLDAVASDRDQYTHVPFKAADGSYATITKNPPYTAPVTFKSPKTTAVNVNYWKFTWTGTRWAPESPRNNYVQTFPVSVKGLVDFNSNGGNYALVGYASHGEAYPIPANAPIKSGFTFDGWFTAAVGGTAVNKNVAVNYPTDANGNTDTAVTVYAHWAKPVKLTFSLAKGKFSSVQKKKYANSKKPYKVTASRKYSVLPTPTRSGYRFFGWWTGSTRVDKNSIVTKTSAHKLTAKWIKKGKGKTVTKAEYAILKKNVATLKKTKNPGYRMTMTDVKAVIGGSGKLTRTFKGADSKTVYKEYKWNGTRGYCRLTFKDGYLDSCYASAL